MRLYRGDASAAFLCNEGFDCMSRQFPLNEADRSTACNAADAPVVVPRIIPNIQAMIEFTCRHCGKGYHVKEELAGRQTTCPACGHLVIVPYLPPALRMPPPVPPVVPSNQEASATSVSAPQMTERSNAVIKFACTACRKSYQVREKFAGRQTKCPACGQLLVVPSAIPSLAPSLQCEIPATASVHPINRKSHHQVKLWIVGTAILAIYLLGLGMLLLLSKEKQRTPNAGELANARRVSKPSDQSHSLVGQSAKSSVKSESFDSGNREQVHSTSPVGQSAEPGRTTSGIRERSQSPLSGQSDVVTALILRLKDQNWQSRENAANALKEMGPPARDAVPSLLLALKDPEAKVRGSAIEALEYIGQVPEETVPALIENLSDKHEDVCIKAAEALASFGPSAQDAVPALTIALRDNSIDVRECAAKALGSIGPDARNAVPSLIKVLDADPGEVVEHVGPIKSTPLRTAAVKALGEIGPAAATAIPALEREWKTNTNYHYNNWELVDSPILALGKIGQTAVPALKRALMDSNTKARYVAAIALGAVGPAAQDAVPALIRALNDRESDVRIFAMGTLGEIGPGAQAAVPDLIIALKDKDENHRYIHLWAANALGRIGPGAKDSIPALLDVQNSEPAYRLEVLTALAKIDAGRAKQSVTILTNIIPDLSAGERSEAAERLGDIGPAAQAAIPVLLAALKDPEEKLRVAAATALGRIDQSGEIAPPALLAAAKDLNPSYSSRRCQRRKNIA